jgi:hypothetical protein
MQSVDVRPQYKLGGAVVIFLGDMTTVSKYSKYEYKVETKTFITVGSTRVIERRGLLENNY